jgi:predicted ArsR family transcriptional regulator
MTTPDRIRGETQGTLLGLLRREDRSITDLAEALGLSDNAVRTHIAGLERDGLVKPVGSRRDTGGKPARVYALTRKGDELFPKAYAIVLGELAGEIARQEGTERVLELMRAVGRRIGAGAGAGGLAQRVALAADALRGLGGDLEVAPDGEHWFLQGFGCPLSQVTGPHPEVCELARALVEEITGRPVAECCDRSGRPRCGFRVEAESS